MLSFLFAWTNELIKWNKREFLGTLETLDDAVFRNGKLQQKATLSSTHHWSVLHIFKVFAKQQMNSSSLWLIAACESKSTSQLVLQCQFTQGSLLWFQQTVIFNSRPTSESSSKELNLSLSWTRPAPDLTLTLTDLSLTASPLPSSVWSPLWSPP